MNELCEGAVLAKLEEAGVICSCCGVECGDTTCEICQDVADEIRRDEQQEEADHMKYMLEETGMTFGEYCDSQD